MTNIAYTKEYLQMFMDIYQPSGCSAEEECQELENGIVILSKKNEYTYCPENPQISHNVFVSENKVLRNNEEIYSFNTIYDSCPCKVFTHQNGHEYLFFKKDLYGYSILDINTMQTFDYFPATSFHAGETFIWCEVFYNPINNIAAVDGCYWASSYGVILADFTDPLKSGQQIEQHGYIEQIYHNNPEHSFFSWSGTDLIITYDDDPEQKKIISSDEYMAWLKKK